MKKRRIKIFLGGYINFTNAQNLNCRALAKYLDKEKYECGAMLLSNGNLSVDTSLNKIKFFKCLRPVRYWRYITYLRGILWCDIAYLPKGEVWKFCSKCLRLFGKKSFITVEGVIEGTNLEKSLEIHKTKEQIVASYKYTSKTFSITKYMSIKNMDLLGLKSDGILYLGIDSDNFRPQLKHKEKLQNIVFIGNNIRYKGIDDFYTIAGHFPYLNFHIVGGGLGYDVSVELEKRGLQNCIYHGLMNHEQLSEFLKGMDLHIFPSRSEGFPKVTLETSAMGVPSIVYSDYGAAEWIKSGKNGFVVNTIEEIERIVIDLCNNSYKLNQISFEAIKLAESFNWRKIVKDWENNIDVIII